MALGGWIAVVSARECVSCDRSAAARAWLVVEGAVEAFGNVYVEMDVEAAVCLQIVRR